MIKGRCCPLLLAVSCASLQLAHWREKTEETCITKIWMDVVTVAAKNGMMIEKWEKEHKQTAAFGNGSLGSSRAEHSSTSSKTAASGCCCYVRSCCCDAFLSIDSLLSLSSFAATLLWRAESWKTRIIVASVVDKKMTAILAPPRIRSSRHANLEAKRH